MVGPCQASIVLFPLSIVVLHAKRERGVHITRRYVYAINGLSPVDLCVY